MSGGVETVADILRKAADLLEPEGAWMQGDFCDAEMLDDATCFCIEGAVAKVLDSGSAWGGELWCDAHLSPIVFEGMSAAQWNDTPGRTQAEVVAKLREAAELAQSAVQS